MFESAPAVLQPVAITPAEQGVRTVWLYAGTALARCMARGSRDSARAGLVNANCQATAGELAVRV